jgi:hypothetical protein
MAAASRPHLAATASAISTASAAAMPRMPRPRSRCQAVPQSSGQPAQLCHMGHLLMENRSGLVVDTRLTHATGTAERDAAAGMLGDRPGTGRLTVGGDTLYDTQD